MKITVLCIVILIIGAGLGYGAAPRSETILETTTVTKTASPITVTETTTITQQGLDIGIYASLVSDIFSNVYDISSEIIEKTEDYGEGKISKANYLSEIQNAKYETERLNEQLIELQPPQKLLEAHTHYVKGLNLLYSGFVLMEDGLILDDDAIIKESIELLGLATQEIGLGNESIEEIKG